MQMTEFGETFSVTCQSSGTEEQLFGVFDYMQNFPLLFKLYLLVRCYQFYNFVVILSWNVG